MQDAMARLIGGLWSTCCKVARSFIQSNSPSIFNNLSSEVLVLAFITAISVSCQNQNNSSSSSNTSSQDLVSAYRPNDQKSFIEIVQTAQSAAQNAKNDMQKGAAKADRDKQICALLSSAEVKNWTGTLSKIDSNSDGKGVLEITIAKDIVVKTWNNALSDFQDNTLLEPSSDLFRKASNFNKGDKVSFSGYFIRYADDCIRESSLTLDGKIKKPEYIFKFEEVSVLSATSAPQPSSALAPKPAPSPAPGTTSNSTQVAGQTPSIRLSPPFDEMHVIFCKQKNKTDTQSDTIRFAELVIEQQRLTREAQQNNDLVEIQKLVIMAAKAINDEDCPISKPAVDPAPGTTSDTTQASEPTTVTSENN